MPSVTTAEQTKIDDDIFLYRAGHLCRDAAEEFLLAWHVRAILETKRSVVHEPKALGLLREAAQVLGYDLVKYPSALVAAIAERADGQ